MSSEIIEALQNPNRERIIREFIRTGDELEFSYIKQLVGDSEGTTRPDHHLDVLVKAGLLKRIKKRGFYKLNEINIQRLRNHYNTTVPICLIGGLGNDLSLFTDILFAFEKISIIPKKYILITSPEIYDKFKILERGKYASVKTKVYEFDFQSILRENIQTVYDEEEKILKKEIHKFEIICETTGGTKPVSNSLIKLSYKYGLRHSYFSGRKISWL